jgi:hypothetical protein
MTPYAGAPVSSWMLLCAALCRVPRRITGETVTVAETGDRKVSFLDDASSGRVLAVQFGCACVARMRSVASSNDNARRCAMLKPIADIRSTALNHFCTTLVADVVNIAPCRVFASLRFALFLARTFV